jgi:Rrf2 family transcriptional regulator, iron-sulfur cluster assembly transcription factor
MFSRSAGYAIEALTHLAVQPSGKLTGAREIAEEAGIPMPFLWKILRNLSQKMLVRSFKGVRGGYELARAPEKISMSEVLAASPDARHSDECVLGLDQCSDAHPCLLHFSWKGVRTQIDDLLKETTLADLARNARRGKSRGSSSTNSGDPKAGRDWRGRILLFQSFLRDVTDNAGARELGHIIL